MRVQGSGSATWLMLFVLGVMAVVGVFGLPQFAPVIASSDGIADGIPLSGSIASYRQAGTGESVAQGVEDLFAPFETIGETGSSSAEDSFLPLDIDRLENRTASEPQIADLFGKRSKRLKDGLDEIAMESRSTQSRDANRRALRSAPRDRIPPADEHLNRRFPATRQDVSESRLGASDKRSIRLEFDSRFGRDEPSRSTATAEGNIREPFRRTIPADDNDANRAETINPADRLPQTWREVVSRLNSLGIRDYRLTAGTQPNEFHFNCFFSPQDNPRVTHRFEADADEPLKAVQIVLTQIDEWRNGR